MKKTFNKAMLFAAALTVLGAPIQAAQLISNGGFESGFTGWTTADQIGSDGSFMLQSGTSSPLLADPVPAPPGGTQAAMTDAAGPGSHVLYQDFTVPTAGPATLSFELYLNNQATDYVTPNTLDFATPALNQQFRVDIITTGADPFSLAAGDILQNVYQTKPGDPLTSGYGLIQVDVTGTLNDHVGQTLRLRFAEADNVNIFHAGVDSIGIELVPEPGTLASLGLVLVGLIPAFRRRK